MNILIIGGTRFMGPIVTRELIAGGHEITLFHRGKTEHDVPVEAHHLHGDRNKLTDYRASFKRLRPDVVLDMMALTQQHAADLVFTMADLAGRLVVASSCDVYKNYGLLWRREPGKAAPAPLTEGSVEKGLGFCRGRN